MKKFENFDYKRPNVEDVQDRVDEIIEAFKRADSAESQSKVIKSFNELSDEIYTASSIAEIRYDVNTADEFYAGEKSFWDEFNPKLASYKTRFAEVLLASKYRKELSDVYGEYFFTKYEIEKKIFDDSIAEDMIEENKLVSEYHKLVAIGKVQFQGKEITLNDITPYRESVDREIRKEANEAYFGYFADNVAEFDKIYDGLVKLRTKMAKKLGYDNFVQMAYDRMGRSDYNPKDVAEYRRQILEDVVPEVNKLRIKQKERLGIENPLYYDYNLKFLSGNPAPKGDSDWIMKNGRLMYDKLGGELKAFYDFMEGHELFDVLSREGKKAGGYCTFIPEYGAPFIFANFNGTQHDVDVLTHEAGHAFQVYNAFREQELSDYLWPTMDAAEIHSMSMEFLSWPYMDLFFEEDAEKYRFSHMTHCIEFLPYGATIDEFQHVVYENPELSPEERRRAFREIEKKYLPHIDYGDNEFLESGGFFFRQLHIFSMPFYYIDYTLAQVCALQFWKKSREDREKTLQIYTELCKAGGSKPFLSLLKIADLKNPFESGNIKLTIEPAIKYLNEIDDKKM